MPTVDMFAKTGILRPWRYESGAIDWNIYVSPNRVIPAPHCHAILAEMDAAGTPATKPQATAAATFLIGAYRATDLNDARLFIRIIVATLQEYPAEVAARAVDELTRTSKWLPSRSELIAACEALMDERRFAERVVKAHLAEHEAIARRAEERRVYLAKRAARHEAEPWIKLVDDWSPLLRPLRDNPSVDDAVERLVQEFGDETVDGWLRDLVESDRPPQHWVAFLDAMTPKMQAARKAMWSKDA